MISFHHKAAKAWQINHVYRSYFVKSLIMYNFSFPNKTFTTGFCKMYHRRLPVSALKARSALEAYLPHPYSLKSGPIQLPKVQFPPPPPLKAGVKLHSPAYILIITLKTGFSKCCHKRPIFSASLQYRGRLCPFITTSTTVLVIHSVLLLEFNKAAGVAKKAVPTCSFFKASRIANPLPPLP